MKRKLFISLLSVLLLASCEINTQKSSIDSESKVEVNSSINEESISSINEASDSSTNETVNKTFDISKYVGKDYNPTFESYSEVSFFSILAKDKNKANVKNRKIEKTKTETTKDEYVDDKGRTHYPIEASIFEFHNFLYFTFEATDNPFLEEKIGNGTISCLIVENNFGEQIVVLNNNGRYYSCVENGAMYEAPYVEPEGEVKDKDKYLENFRCFEEFSAHKYYENFDLVKDPHDEAKTRIIFNYGLYKLNKEELTSVTFRNNNTAPITYTINEDSIYYDDSSVTFSLNEIKAMFGLETNNEGELTELEQEKIVTIYKINSSDAILPSSLNGRMNAYISNATTVEEIESLYDSYLQIVELFNDYRYWRIVNKNEDVYNLDYNISSCDNINELLELANNFNTNTTEEINPYAFIENQVEGANILKDEIYYYLDDEKELINQFLNEMESLDKDDDNYIDTYYSLYTDLMNKISNVIQLYPCQVYYYNTVLQDEEFERNWMEQYRNIVELGTLIGNLNLRILMIELQNEYLSKTEDPIPEMINVIDKDIYYEMIEKTFD